MFKILFVGVLVLFLILWVLGAVFEHAEQVKRRILYLYLPDRIGTKDLHNIEELDRFDKFLCYLLNVGKVTAGYVPADAFEYMEWLVENKYVAVHTEPYIEKYYMVHHSIVHVIGNVNKRKRMIRECASWGETPRNENCASAAATREATPTAEEIAKWGAANSEEEEYYSSALRDLEEFERLIAENREGAPVVNAEESVSSR